MSQIVRLPKRLHRDFRLPGVKPVGPVVLEKNSLLAPKTAIWVMNEGASQPHSLGVPAATTVHRGTPTWAVASELGVDFGGTSSYSIDNNSGVMTPSEPFTVFAKVRRTGNLASFSGILSSPLNISNEQGWFVGGTVSNRIEFYMHNSTWSSAKSAILDVDVDYWVVATYDGSNIRIYLNKTLEATTAKTVGAYGSSQPGKIGEYAEGATSKQWNGIIYAAGITHKAWSEGEISGFIDEPWRSIAQPANAPGYFIPAAGGGTAHSLTLSESIGASTVNSALWAIAANAPESIAATSTQSASATFAVSASESAAASSAQSSSGATAVTVSESSALTSGQSAGLQIVASASESAAISDTESVAIVSGLVAVTVSESIGATSTQAANQAASVSVAESASTSSDQSASTAFATAVAEAVASTDLQSISFALESSISEALVTGSAQASVISIDGAVSESIGATSTQSVAAAFAPSVAFSTAVAESVITAAAYQTSYADSIQAVSVESIGIAGETVSFTITVQRKTTLATHIATATLN